MMKNKTKKRLMRLSGIISIILAIFNIVAMFANNAYGVEASGIADLVTGGGIALNAATGGIAWIFIYGLKLLVLAIAAALQGILSIVYSSLEDGIEWAGMKEIIFAGADKCSKFLNVDFFNVDATSTDAIDVFRVAIGKWYYIIRLIATAILLVILIYVGIRMALSTVASDQAKYKQMLVDWASSLALLYLLHYIIVFVIKINNSLVSALYEVAVDNDPTIKMLASVGVAVLMPGLSGLFATAFYALYVGSVFSFFVLYLKRMITVAFLIMIAPLITITYSIDKMGDGKAQALNAWLKEFSYNILIQPFHCIIFMSFFDAISKMVGEDFFTMNTIGAWILAIMVLRFMKQAEEILRKIFHFEASSMSSLRESGQSIANASGTFFKGAMTAGTAFSAFKNSKVITDYRNSRAKTGLNSLKERRQLKEAFKNSGQGGSFRAFRESEEGQEALKNIRSTNAEEMRKKAEEKRNKKIEAKAKKNYEKHNPGKTYEELKERAANGDASAQQSLDGNRAAAREQINNSKSQTVIRGAKKFGNGAKSFGQGASKRFSNMRERVEAWSQTDYGKAAIEVSKQSMKIASAIGLGAFAYGASGQMNDAITAGQIGFGFTKGLMENSKKTITDNMSDLMQKLCEVTGLDPSEVGNQIMEYSSKGLNGEYKADRMYDKQKEIEGRLEVALDETQIKNIFNNILRNIQIEGVKIDLDKIMDDHGVADQDRGMVEQELKQFVVDQIGASVYNGGIVPGRDAAGLELFEMSNSVQRAVMRAMPSSSRTDEPQDNNNNNNSDSSENEQPITYETRVQNIQNIFQDFNNTENITEDNKKEFINNIKSEITNIDKTTIEQSQVEHIENIENIINNIDQSTNQIITQEQINNIQNEINQLNAGNN